MNKNRILILSGIFPPDIGGPAAFLDPLVRELIKNGYFVRVLTFGWNKIKYSYPVFRVADFWPGLLKSLIYLIKGLWLGRCSDIVYNQDLYTAGLTALAIKKLFKKKLVTRFVGDSAWEKSSAEKLIDDNILTFQEKKYSKKIECRKEIRKKILEGSDKIIVASDFLKRVAVKIGLSEEKISVIYNSVDFLDVKPSAKKEELKEKLNLSGKILLTIARLAPWKGIGLLIEIMPDLIKKYGQIELIVVGRGPEEKRLKRLAKEIKVENNVIFIGKAERQEINDYLAVADVFLLNTNYEGMSHTLLEAMKAGVAIITTPAGGNPETVKNRETGLLVEYNNKVRWLEAIALILDDKALSEKLGQNAKNDLTRFSWENLIKKTINIFEVV